MDDIFGNGSWIGWDIGRAVFWSLLIYWLQMEVQNIFYSWLYILKASYFKLSTNVSHHPTIHWKEAKRNRYVKLTLSTHLKYPPLIRYLNSRNCWNLYAQRIQYPWLIFLFGICKHISVNIKYDILTDIWKWNIDRYMIFFRNDILIGICQYVHQ